MGDNVSKFYNAFSQKYDNFGTEQEFRDFLKGAKRENIDNLYKAFNAKYDNFNSADDMVSYLGWSDSSSKKPVDNSKWAVTPSPYWNPQEQQQEAQPQPQPAPAPQPQAQQTEENPFPYRGGLEQETEELRAQLAEAQGDADFVKEYEERKAALDAATKDLRNLKGDIRNTGIDLEKFKADGAWLKENAERYEAAKTDKAQVDEINGRLAEIQKEEERRKLEEARKARNERMRGQSENNSIRMGAGGFASYPKDMSMVDVGNSFAADQLDAMSDQELDKGSKFDSGYEGNTLDKVGTAIKQYVEGGINNVDLGSLTAGLSEYTAFKTVRDVAEKNNGLISDAFKKLGYDDEAAGKIISDAEAAWEQLQPAYEELNPMVAELKDMEATLEALANSGDAERYTAAYNKYKKKYDEYAKRLEEYKPLQDTVDKYTELMDAVQEAVASGLSDSERDVLDSFARYIRTKDLSAATESNAAKAGAGFEQSLEFILDFIVTRGLGKTGAKAASKIAANSLLKKTLGETGAKIVGRGLADMGTSAIRTSLMFPRNLAAYGERITSMDRKGSGVDEFGRYTFDRTKANAALDTALSQYIEYWSEGFGEYFGAAEQALFKNATKLAPKTAIGQTLKNYRGSIGKYLDYGKFDGMFNEMLEEVVGSTFNALNGWVSSKIDPNGPGVGDKEALKEFVAGDNLATLFFSFLPMSAIGAATNMKAYHQMKERYDKSVGILNPFIEDGSINREDLEDLTSRTAELSPEQIMDKFKEISRKAAEAQEKKGKVLPKNFDQALAGYLEGSFSMNLQREAWEDSRKIFAVASAYTAQYENPDARSAWDLAQEEQAARAAALAAGFTEEDLDKDSAILARESAELEETEPERSNILYNYSIAKGQSNGLKDGYDNQTRGVNERNAQFVRSNIDTNGQVVQATLNGNTPVYITQTDATVNPDGTVSTPTGDGVVEYVDQAGNKGTAKASAFSGVVSTATGEYIESKSADYSAKRQAAFETARNTVSPTGQARALNERVGQSVIVTDHNGVYQPFKVERLTNGGSSVVLSGDKKALQGVAEAMGIRVPTSGYLEAPVTSLYPLLAKEEDGSLSTGVGETSQQEAAPAAEQAAGLGDLRDQTVPISVNGQVQNAHVIDMSDGSVMYEELDGNGDVVRTSRLSETDFARAMQEAANPTPAAEETMTAEEAPVEEPATPVIPVDEKTGEKMYAAPGVEVADAIADLYATEGLTEADVDQYIAEEAAKAEAARNPERGSMSPQAWGQAKQEAARVADFWAAMQRAAEQRKAQQEAAIEEAVEEATPVETTEAQPVPESKQRLAPAATPMTVDSKRKVVARLKNWARRTGVKVNIIRSVDEVKDETARKALKEGRALTGWYNDKTGQVDIFLPNVMNAVEADKTFIHETVAHKGLRGLLGEEGYDALCDRVWNELMTPEEQEEFMEYNRHLQGSEEYLHRAAADEFIARLSENMDMQDNRNIFEKFVDWVMDLLKIGGNVSGIEEGATEKATGEGSLTRSDLYDLLEDSLKRFEKGRKKLNTESLPAEIQNEMQEKGLVMDGGAVMDEQQGELKKATGYQTPNELDMESSPEVGNVRFSESTMPAWARNYMTYADAKRHVVQVLENFVRDVAADELVHGMVPTGVYKYGEKSSGSFSGPLRTNIEYIVTFDMDTSCPRSLQYLEYVNQIEAKIGRPLTQRESVQLIEMMRMYGQMIPCVYCYCENKRQALKQYYTDFMRARNGVINAKTEEEALAAMYGHNTTAEAQESNDPAVVLTPAALEVFKKWRQEKDYNPTIEQLWYQYRNDRNVILTVLDNMLDSGAVSTDLSDQKITNALCKDLGITGTEANGAVRDIVSEWKWDRIEDRRHNNFTRIEDEDDLVVDNRTLTLWREMTSYGKSASGAKNVLRYVPYTDELKDLSQEQRDFINGLGGLRMHSSNDFRIDYVLDYFQFMADMAVNHMLGHTYTKSPEFVRIFGNSGYKINMSIAAYEDSRGIRPNADEGFDWTTARELREAFPNAGVMLMATSDAQIQFALDNDWIDMCIPFHHSGLPKAIWYEMGAWSDYSSTQNEKFLNATEMRKELKADGVAVPNKLTAAAVEKMYIDHFNIKILRGKDGKRMRPHFLPGPTPKDGVTIPGHNNDYETYMRLCREYGVHPRFYGIKVKDNTPEGGGRKVDITEHPGYMKFIKETARTDSPQTAIEFNFDQPSEALGGMSPIEYALDELREQATKAAENAKAPVRNIYERLKKDTHGIVPEFINGVINHEEEYRKTHNGEELPLDYLTPDSRKWFMTERKALESAYKDFDTIPYHPHEYDENGNLIMTNAEGQPETDAEMVAEEEVANTMFREVTDPATVEWFNNAPKTTGFRTVVKKAGNLGQVKGKKKAATSSFMRNVIEQAEENPDIADENGKVKLIKPKREDGKKLTDVGSVDYNPYIHLRLDKINRQFKDAWKRDDLIYIESEVPVEEVPDFRGEKTPDYSKSPYHAEKAALPVGIHDWNGGALMLSRYDRPFREVPWEEVADAWAADEDFQKNGVHFDIVPPQIRDLLTERGIEIIPPHNGMGQDCFDAYNEWKGGKNGPDGGGTRFREANRNQLGFVSNADAALDRIKMDKATPEQWVKMLEKEGGLKAGEDKWLGLSDWLKSQDRKSITKDEIADYIDEHRIQIEEVNYRDMDDFDPVTEAGSGLDSEFDDLGATDAAFEQMQEKYPGLKDIMQIWRGGRAGNHLVLRDEVDEDTIERYMERWGILENPIQSMRLEYTTEGLDNKREIALTVPTIEPWNQSDKIHFGDAGNGRAVAWIRFGDTLAANEGVEAAKERHREAARALGEYRDGLQEKYADSDQPYYEACTPEELSKLKSLKEEEHRLYEEWDNLNATPRRVLVIDEIQSKRHQEGREHGYAAANIEALEQKWRDASKAYDDFIDSLKEKYGGYEGMFGHITEEENQRAIELNDASIDAANAVDRAKGGIPAAPFEKNWHELAMKRMLRLAAEEGYDAVAWTTGGQQAERYNIGKVVRSVFAAIDQNGERHMMIYPSGGRVIIVTHDENGNISNINGDNSGALSDAKNISDIVGKNIAAQALTVSEPGTANGKEFKGDGLLIGGEGMKGFYDDILPRFMNKYGKKWGVKVSDITLPNVEKSGEIMHAVPVTQEMKESVMQGQTMFRDRDAERREEMKQESMANDRFNKQLGFTEDVIAYYQKNHRMPPYYKPSTYRLGNPFGNLLSAGMEDIPIRMKEENLLDVSANGPGLRHDYHKYEISDLRDLVTLLNHPIAVFRSGRNGFGILLNKKDRNGNNYYAYLRGHEVPGEGIDHYEIISIYPVDKRGKKIDLLENLIGEKKGLAWSATDKRLTSWINGMVSNLPSYYTTIQEVTANIRNKFGNKQDLLRNDAKNLRPSGNTMFRERITPESQKLFDAAKERFGTTRDMREAGYILPDGTMLDFSGRHWTSGGDNSWLNGMRQVDHREISDIGYERDGNTPTGLETDMSDFIRRGAIRINYPGSINLAKRPTWDQVDALERLIRMDNSFVRVDFGDGSHTDHYADYDNARPAKVIDDIYGYFDDGVKPSGNTMFREARPVDARSAQAGYEEEINRKVTNFLLEWQDQDIPVRIAINQVMNEVGMENLPEDCDYLTRHNLVSSRADAQMHNYKLFFFEPMMQTIGQIEDILVGGKPSFFDRLTGRRQKRLDAYKKIVNYCYAVSALERNAWKRAEAEELKRKALERLAEKWEKESEAINADSRLNDAEKAESLERAEKRYQKESREIEDKYADRDYSGITALMGRPKEEWQEAEDDARAMIADFQRSVNNNDLINEMWDRIRACTDFNLEHAYKYGLLSRAEYERLHGTESQPRMWEYYIPLRGFAEDTAEDLYNYTMFTSDMAGGDVVKKAKGRVTEADDPFATMRHISEQEIVQGLQNWAKQALYNFVLRAGNNSLLTQVEPWYVKEPGTDNWYIAEPDKDQSLEAFEADMQRAYENGEARRGRNGLKLGHIMGNKMHRNQHMIRLKLNGAEKMIWVNGNNVLAQAVNGISGWNNKILNGVRTVNRALSQFYTTYSLKFLTKNKLRDTQFSRIAALVDEPQAYLRQLEKNWWANNGYVAFGYPMMKLVSAWESGELEKKENRTEREQLFLDFMYDGGATGYTMINSMDKIKRELERMVKNAGRGERNIPIIDWYAKGVGALNEASELLTRFTFYQTSRMMGRSRERSAYDAKESSVNFNRRGLRSGIGVSGWTSAAASALYLFINPAIQGLDKFVRLHKSHPWRMGLVDATYFMMGFVNSLLNAMIAGASDGDGDDDEKMGPDWYWNIPEWVRRSNMIIGSPFKKLGKWGYLVIALPIEYKGFYAMGELASALVQGKYAAKDAPTIANEVVGVVAELLPVNPVEGYTPGDNPAMSVVRNMMPDIAAPIMDVATNRSFAGIPLWKENIYDEAQPLSQSAFASTPEILNKAVIKLSEVTSDMPWHVDIPSGAVRGLLKGYGGGAYTFVEDMSKLIFADEAHPRRWDNVPFVSGFTGYLEEDRRDSFNSDALQRYKELSDDVVKRVRSAAPGEDLKAADIYNHPESLPQNARVTILLNSDRYILGQMYYNGMLKAGDDVKKLRSNWNKAKKAYLEIADDKNVSDEAKDAAEKEVQRTWLEYTMSEDSLVDRLMEEEYNHARQKIANGVPYERKETLGEKAYNLTNRK